MKHYIAIINEEKCPHIGQIIGNTKTGIYKGMNKEAFVEAVGKSTCFRFEVKEVYTDYSKHREFLNDKWVSASHNRIL